MRSRVLPLDTAQRRLLVAFYLAQRFILDDLPHSIEFEQDIVVSFNKSTRLKMSNWSVWNTLVRLRKASKLPRWDVRDYKGPVASYTSKRERQYIITMYNEQGLALDKLPYTPGFAAMARRADWVERDLWLVMIDMRKDGSLPRKSDD